MASTAATDAEPDVHGRAQPDACSGWCNDVALSSAAVRFIWRCCGAVHVGLGPLVQEARKQREALTAEQVSRIQNDILFPPTAEEIEERRQAEQQVGSVSACKHLNLCRY